MANPLRYKIYDFEGQLMAATRHLMDAATMLGCLGQGKIRCSRLNMVLWNTGREDVQISREPAKARKIMRERLDARVAKRMEKAQ